MHASTREAVADADAETPIKTPLLEVRDLRVSFNTRHGSLPVVDGVGFEVEAGKTLAVVGESGSGKSVTSLALMGLLPTPPARIDGGHAYFQSIDLLSASRAAMRRLRGKHLSMVFQEPLTSLHPTYTVGNQIVEALRLHTDLSRKAALEKAIDMLRQVGIPDPARRVMDYPHKLSGGMRQRVMIAIALACNPQLLIADEPTTALDVTVQAQILDLLTKLQQRYHTAIMLITHDLGVVAEMAADVVVMYTGKVVEKAPVAAIFEDPQHPYTVGLLAAVPRIDAGQHTLRAVPGTIPDPAHYPAACRFHPRCPFAVDRCRREEPPLMEVRPGHWSACWRTPLESLL